MAVGIVKMDFAKKSKYYFKFLSHLIYKSVQHQSKFKFRKVVTFFWFTRYMDKTFKSIPTFMIFKI